MQLEQEPLEAADEVSPTTTDDPLGWMGRVEAHLAQNPPEIEEARAAFRQWLLAETSHLEVTGSIGDALAALAASQSRNPLHAATALRYLSVPALLPKPSLGNNIERSIVTLCEISLPTTCAFLKIDPKRQTFERFAALETAHLQVSHLLAPIRDNYGDIEALIKARTVIMGNLGHSLVREYCANFKLNEVRSTIANIFSGLKRVSAQDSSFLTDYDDCQRSIGLALESIDEIGTFLSYQYLRPFLENSKSTLSRYLSAMRTRFSSEIRTPSANGQYTLGKRYPLRDVNRNISISVPLLNSGPGLATDVRISAATESDSIYVSEIPIHLGSILPGDFSVVIDVLVLERTDEFQISLEVSWGEIGLSARKSELLFCKVNSQNNDIDWQAKAYWTPYSTDVAEGDQFVGRDERVRLVASKFLRSPMEPFYITGQKRVGKTSLVKAAADFAVKTDVNGNIAAHYILWGSVAYASPYDSMRALGQEIETFIRGRLPNGTAPEPADYSGSLSPLIRLADLAGRLVPEKKFVIIIDEFDEIHQELYRSGNLAETFFANIRALSRCRNISIGLVGGENMPFIMDRQGQKLNNFPRVNVSYYSRSNEWDDFELLVRRPSENILTWHNEAISEIFNISNGNPYFAKVICSQVCIAAVAERDSDVSATEVQHALDKSISSLGANYFSHMWRDGVAKPLDEQEPDILKRMRVLVSIARCLRKGIEATATNVVEHRMSSELSAVQIVPVLNDFIRRDVLNEKDGVYHFSLPIFERWLRDVGVGQLVSDEMNDEIASALVREENAAVVLSEEIVALTATWPNYCGRHVGTDDVRAWINQVSNPRDQRILFKLLQRTKFYSETMVRERLKTAHSLVRPTLPEFVMRKLSDRREDVLLTYFDGAGKSGATYASLYAEENGIAARCVLSPERLKEVLAPGGEFAGKVAAVILMDDIAATGQTLSDKVSGYLSANEQIMIGLAIKVITLVATPIAQSRIERVFSQIERLEVDFRSCEILEPKQFAFPEKQSFWASDDEAERAKALCTDLGSRIHKQRPLGFGGMGLLIVFPSTVPNNSLPILYSYAAASSAHKWKPLFPRPIN